MNLPLISIIVPVYNVEHFLADCLDSLINQTYTNIEIITVNDGSKDNSLSILNSYAERDERVLVISQLNAGVSAARNKGIEQANGKYICFVDGDDWIDVHTCKKALEFAESGKNDVILWNYVKEFRTSSEEVHCISKVQSFDGRNIHLLRQRIIGPIGKQLAQPQFMDSLSTVWGKLYKTDLIKKNNISFVSTKELGTGEDLLFNVEYFQYVEKAHLLTNCLSHYRKYNMTSITSVYKSDLFLKWQNLQDRIWKVVQGDSLLIKAFYNRIAFTVIGLGLNEVYSTKSFWKQRNQLKNYLQTPKYVTAYKQLNLRHFPLHWKVFFFCAKYGYYTSLLFLLRVIQFKRNENN